MKKQILNEEFRRMQKLAGLITESEFKRQVIKEMKMFDLKDKNGKPTELFKIENFSSVEDAIDMLNKYYGMGENEVDSFYTDETGTDYNYAYVASDGYTRFVKSLDEFSDGYQTEEEWGVASEEEIMNESKLNEMSEETLVSTLKENGFEVSSNPAWIVRNSETGDDYILYTESGDYISHKLDGDFPEGVKIMGEGADDWLEQFLETEKKTELNENIEDYYGEIQAAEDEFAGGMETGSYTEEEYLNALLDASNEELEDFQGGYYDIAKVLSDLSDEEKQEAIENIKNWAKSKL